MVQAIYEIGGILVKAFALAILIGLPLCFVYGLIVEKNNRKP